MTLTLTLTMILDSMSTADLTLTMILDSMSTAAETEEQVMILDSMLCLQKLKNRL